ncbi:hypothetical protein BU24DRAFT_494083 [Aaosphaeria arxii CBS 175.79]|uniref:gamma-glutamylcyclotransferase n=1 Tax=Aaosphaeria arxii CBS 175.79 TaxID=1450172 RepID=A0A6A5XLF8_9PLEO|nr:uncharacterized protein BU24DRAFT_494083 [Aaosphaeria arxii CBS 175.79]KAF2013647.1 hypothetical protein BU24DRAFT_494083 [Aaosphaeria arxii CBS 175.79]
MTMTTDSRNHMYDDDQHSTSTSAFSASGNVSVPQTSAKDDKTYAGAFRRAFASLRFSRKESSSSSTASKRIFEPLPPPSQSRLDASLSEEAIDVATFNQTLQDQAPQEKEKTVLYLAYGSNLCNETFRGVRGIRPLSQVNVVVPSLKLTFDLPGVPYMEPCFANCMPRTPPSDSSHSEDADDGNDGQHEHIPPYHKDRWTKGMVGCVYEVTLRDFATIIATEGGGSSYQDVLTLCYPIPSDSTTVPTSPQTQPFKAHTLFSPRKPISRPDPAYAQASARYLNLLTSGALELRLPSDYQAYLEQIRPYTITTLRQKVGKGVFITVWAPFLLFVLQLNKVFQDEKGRAPAWLTWLSGAVFGAMWTAYDGGFKAVFGDGERTEGLDDENKSTSKSESASTGATRKRRASLVGNTGTGRDEEKALLGNGQDEDDTA